MALITTAEAAVILKVTPVRVRQLIRDRQLFSEKRGRDHLLERDEVERFDRVGRRKGGRPRKHDKPLR
jgi:excisionase family DNA binding protein